MTTSKLGIILMATNTANKESLFNEAVLALEAASSVSVISMALTAPPVSPADGDFYIPKTGATGDWNTWANKLVFYYSGWRMLTPFVGMKIYDQNTQLEYRWDGTNWNVVGFTEVEVFVGTTVLAINALVHSRVMAKQLVLPVNLTGSQGYATTAPSADTVFDLRKNGASVGSMTFASGSNVATFTFAAKTTFAVGDRFSIVAPAALNGLTDIAANFLGTPA